MNELAEFYFQRANTHFDNGEIELAIDDLNQAIVLDPNNAVFSNFLAKLKYNVEINIIIEDLTAIIDNSFDADEIRDAYHERAHSFEKVGRNDELIADISWLLNNERESSISVLYNWRGHHYKIAGKFKNAIADFVEASRLSPNNYSTLIQLGQCHYHAGQYKAAINDLSRAIEVNANNSSHAEYHWRGMAYYKYGDYKHALADFKESVRLLGGVPITDVSQYIGVYQGTY